MEFSLFYFSGDGSTANPDKYRLLIEGAKFADKQGFAAIWTPERHFHAFGGLYPNPSVVGAAIATITQNIQIRAGSVVLPLQNPIRVAEEWSVVDNLSGGRVGLAFASGWHPNDFVLYPEKYDNRKEIMWRDIKVLQQLWQGEELALRGGGGNLVKVRSYPRPLQKQLPIWMTSLAEETFIAAGKAGVNILTSPLYHSFEEIAQKIKIYRQCLQEYGHGAKSGKVVLMMHTFIGENIDIVKDKVRKPFSQYLKTHYSLVESLVKSLNLPMNLDNLTTEDLEDLFTFSFESYFNTKVLMGTPDSCKKMLVKIKDIGVDEVAALIDFGVGFDDVMTSLQYLQQLKLDYKYQFSRTSINSLSG